MLSGIKKWTVDWRGDGSPEAGDIVRYVTPTGICTFVRAVYVRAVKNRNPLPEDVVCRYAVGIELLHGRPVGERVAWTLYAHAKKREYFKRSNRFSPLLDA